MQTVLVLEDESSVMSLLRHILGQYSLIEATTAEEALRTFIDHDHQIDCLVADVTLQTSSGIQVALLLRSELPELPVIFTSGYPVSGWSDRAAADLERLGSTSVSILHKPFQPQALVDAVRQCLYDSPRRPENPKTRAQSHFRATRPSWLRNRWGLFL
jgi:DNA-binding NtrC family response regulator